jgi:hypothetical protein
MAKPDPDHDFNDRLDHDNDNGRDQHEHAVAAAPTGGALASLAALGKTLNAVDTTSVIGGGGMPMLSFKREGDGTWAYGQKRIIVEDGSLWGVNPLSFRYGYICFGDGNSKPLGERLVPVSQPKPDATELPDHGFPWVEQWCVKLKCINGTDAGVEVDYKPTTVGGIQAIAGLIEAVRDRLNGGEHGGKVAPIVQLHKDSYQKPPYGRVWVPRPDIVDWMPLSGPAGGGGRRQPPAPTSPPPAEQPRRNRRAA